MADEKDPASAASGAPGDQNPAAKASEVESPPKADSGPPEAGSPPSPPPDAKAQTTAAAEAAHQATASASDAGSPRASGEDSSAAKPASGEAASAAEPASPEATPASDADPWAQYDPVLEVVATQLRLGVGTCCGEQWSAVEGRFLGWDNRAGWRCLLRLLRPPEEEMVVLVAEGPPLPGGRARVMVLGGFPAQLDAQMLRAALELGFAIGETWGPAEEPPPGPAAAAAATDGPTGNGPGSA
jgi:hypothetical protein